MTSLKRSGLEFSLSARLRPKVASWAGYQPDTLLNLSSWRAGLTIQYISSYGHIYYLFITCLLLLSPPLSITFRRLTTKP